jgi:hypothetical protein
MNIPFADYPMQKTAWIACYNDVHAAVKAAYPHLSGNMALRYNDGSPCPGQLIAYKHILRHYQPK